MTEIWIFARFYCCQLFVTCTESLAWVKQLKQGVSLLSGHPVTRKIGSGSVRSGFWCVVHLFLQLLHYLLSTLHHRISYRKIGLNSLLWYNPSFTQKLPSTATRNYQRNGERTLGGPIWRTLLAFPMLWSLKYPKVWAIEELYIRELLY